MARIRTIKPDFFTSEDIVGISPLARLLYVATWLEADREGRFIWRPKTLKLRYLPGDQCDIEMLADELVSAGLVVTYEINGQTFAEIPTFAKHQVINNRETASTIPARVPDASGTREPRVTDATTTPLMGKEGKGREGKPSAPAAPTADFEPDNRKPAIRFKTFVAECRAKGENAIPDDDTVFEWAKKAGLSDDFLRLAWMEFRDRYTDSTKRYRDWRHVFRNAVRDNWYGIWFCEENGKMSLTSKGRTIQQTMREAA